MQQRYMVRIVKEGNGKKLFNPIHLGVFLASSPYGAITAYRREEPFPVRRDRIDAVLYKDEHGNAIKYTYEDQTIREGLGTPTKQEVLLYLQEK